MIYVALGSLLALCVITVTFASILRWSTRQHARERELLVNQVCHLAGRSWVEAPAFAVAEEVETDESWAMPEQHLVA